MLQLAQHLLQHLMSSIRLLLAVESQSTVITDRSKLTTELRSIIKRNQHNHSCNKLTQQDIYSGRNQTCNSGAILAQDKCGIIDKSTGVALIL